MNQVSPYAFARMAAQGDLRPVESGLHQLCRGQWIICRSNFGLELAEVLSEPTSGAELHWDPILYQSSSAQWVRDATDQDHWLWGKIHSLNQNAIPECQRFLDDQELNDTLLDISSSIDGKSVAFEFLGTASEHTGRHLEKLTEIYQAFVKDSEIYKQLEHGCGPGCGTTASCGSKADGKSGCLSCSVASRCKKH
jgi:hypothetical protein